MIARLLSRLAVVWIVGLGGLLLTVGVMNGTLAQAHWPAIGALVLGPAALALALAWAVAPQPDPRTQMPFPCDCASSTVEPCACCLNGAHHLCQRGCDRSGWKLPPG